MTVEQFISKLSCFPKNAIVEIVLYPYKVNDSEMLYNANNHSVLIYPINFENSHDSQRTN